MVPIQGVHPARVITRVRKRSSLQLTSLQGHIFSEAPRNCAYVMITNYSDEELTVPKATVLGIAEDISESIVVKINREGESRFDVPTKSHSCEKNKALFQKLLKEKLNHLQLTSLQGHIVSEAPRNCAYVKITNFSNERSEERRVGKECVRRCRSRWSPYH
jgi:hypothetical protein